VLCCGQTLLPNILKPPLPGGASMARPGKQRVERLTKRHRARVAQSTGAAAAAVEEPEQLYVFAA
jgi:hypothetical protein